MAWTSVAKPSSSSYTNVAKPSSSNYTKVARPTTYEYIIPGMKNMLGAPLTYAVQIRMLDNWTKVAKPT